jgi:hypothetical protein
MKTSVFASIITITLILFSCIKHEIIPAPTPKVVLKSQFKGYIDGSGTLTEFNEGVNGYTCLTNNDVFLQTTAVYYSSIASTTNPTTSPAIRLGLGTLSWSGALIPTVEQFNAFFANYILPPYRTGASNGLEIQYTTALGAIYTSRQTTTAYQDAVFSNITQESDDTGDYSKFVCNFNCYVYWTAGTPPLANKDSLKIQSGVFKGWFKK